MNTHHNAKLVSYLAGAGAVGLANLPTELEAEVLHKDFRPDVSLPGGFSTNRIRVTINPTSGLTAAVDSSPVSVFGDGTVSLYPATFDSRFGQPPAPYAGTIQGTIALGKNPGPSIQLYPGLCGGSTIGGQGLPSAPALEGEHYLGFQYRATGGSSYYGWIRYEYTAPADPESPVDSAITLLEGALESTPGKGIVLPGSCPVPPIPLLALGAVGVEADRFAIRWESKPGMIYKLKSTTDLASDPSTWEPVKVDGKLEIPATPPANTHSIERPDDPARFYRVEEYPAPPVPPVTVFSDDFENEQGDWTTGSDGAPGSEWELGAPFHVGPAAANSGLHCFGTNLDADYDFHADVWLRSPAIDLTNASSATLSYAQFTDTEQAFDPRKVFVLDAADDSVIAEIFGDGPSTLSWQTVNRSLPATALRKRIKIEFRFTSDEIQNFAGWYIDDVKVTIP